MDLPDSTVTVGTGTPDVFGPPSAGEFRTVGRAPSSVHHSGDEKSGLYISIRYTTIRYMARRKTSTPEILLGLLTVEPMSGYDLGGAIRGTVGLFWNESYGQIYPTLRRLAADGFVSAREERRPGKPSRRVYEITPQGRERLRAWLALPPQPEVPRNEFLLKLFFGDQIPRPTLIEHVERFAQEHRAVLDVIAQAEQESRDDDAHLPASRYWRLAARYGRLELAAHLAWAEETLAELAQLADDDESPLATEPGAPS